MKLHLNIPVALVALMSCAPETQMPTRDEGAALFADNCAACHGEDATGWGEMADLLDPSPADLTTITLRNGGTFPRAEMISVIDGYHRTGEDEVMPDYGSFLKGPTVPIDTGDGILTPTPGPLVALMLFLESVQVE